MRVSIVAGLFLAASLGGFGASYAAETHVVVATDDFTWKSATGESSTDNPLVVLVKKGDIIDFQIPEGLGDDHGVVTTATKDGTVGEDPSLVNPCGGTPTETAVLDEECDAGAESKFNTIYTGSMKLKVRENFAADTTFWCVVHFAGMPGVIKLAPEAAQ